MTKHKVLVTGAGGFVGGHLLELLNKQTQYQVFASVYHSSDLVSQLLPATQIFTGDLTNYEFADTLIKETKPDIIFHLAAISTVHNSVEKAKVMLTTNSILQYNLLEAYRRHVPKSRLLAICSANQYGLVKETEVPIDENQPFRPLNPYAVSKLSQEFLAYQYHLAYNLDIIRIRAFNHTGERQTPNFVVPAFAKQIAEIEHNLKPPIIKVGNLEAIRDFTYVGDMVEAYLVAAEQGKKGEVYNIGSGKGVKIQTILNKLIQLSSVEIKIEKDPTRMRPSDVPVLIADNSKFQHDTKWQPKVSIDETLQKVLNYWRQQIRRQ